MRTCTTNAELFAADIAAKTLPEPTAAALEDRDGFRFASVRIGEIRGHDVYQWELLGGSGYSTGFRFRRPWIDEPLEYIRASGACTCDKCGKSYYDHPRDGPEFEGQKWLHRICSGKLVKL